jgi:hypothetical protein
MKSVIAVLIWVMVIFLAGFFIGEKCHADQMNGDVSIQYYENVGPHPNPGIEVNPDFVYHFDKQNLISVDTPYKSTLGWQDTILTVDHNFSKHVDSYFQTFLPTSLQSQNDSLKGGGSANLVLIDDFGPLNVKFDNGVLGWDYDYTTTPAGDYTPAFALSDKLTLGLTIVSKLKFVTTFHLYTFQDFDGQTHNVYRDSIGLTYAPTKLVSFDAFYSYKNADLADVTSLEGGHYQVHAGFALHF